MKDRLLLVVGSMFILTLLGCGPRTPEGFPALYPVTMTVLQEGKPVEGMIVSLRSSDPAMNWAVGGKTGANGSVLLRTHGLHDGAPLGKYKVVLTKQENEGYDEYLAAKDRYDQAAAEKIDVKFYSIVEKIYNAPETTPIEVEITPKTRTIEVDAGPRVRIEVEFMRD